MAIEAGTDVSMNERVLCGVDEVDVWAERVVNKMLVWAAVAPADDVK